MVICLQSVLIHLLFTMIRLKKHKFIVTDLLQRMVLNTDKKKASLSASNINSSTRGQH